MVKKVKNEFINGEFEEIDEDNDRMLQMSLRTHELLHKEWAVPMKNRRTGW